MFTFSNVKLLNDEVFCDHTLNSETKLQYMSDTKGFVLKGYCLRNAVIFTEDNFTDLCKYGLMTDTDRSKVLALCTKYLGQLISKRHLNCTQWLRNRKELKVYFSQNVILSK